MPNIKTLARREEQEQRFGYGHALCAGCGIPIVVRTVLNSIKEPVVVANATGCLEVATTLYPYTAWNVPWIHNAFENAAATISGVEAAYRVLKRKGKVTGDVKFVAFGGDGGTYDIGLQSLSGALERGHSFLYVCYDNEAYMNTGIQRSSATPMGAFATTEPMGKESFGKRRHRKDLTQIIAGHHIPYVAQASISHWQDLSRKVGRAVAKEGPSFINVMSTCFRGWRHDANLTTEIARLAVETRFWPLYEIEDGQWRLNYAPKERVDIREWLKPQGRFAHLFRPEERGEVIAAIQEEVDREWEFLKNRCQVAHSA
jgi:pyruvate ferredoxin oxidoreductase beta subunit